MEGLSCPKRHVATQGRSHCEDHRVAHEEGPLRISHLKVLHFAPSRCETDERSFAQHGDYLWCLNSSHFASESVFCDIVTTTAPCRDVQSQKSGPSQMQFREPRRDAEKHTSQETEKTQSKQNHANILGRREWREERVRRWR